jgi:starch synthase (maltosyl-transferring)
MMSRLQQVINQLETRRKPLFAPYFIPGLWADGKTTEAIQVDPYTFYHGRLLEISLSEQQPLVAGIGGGEWSRYATIYNLHPRVTTAFDHNDDGQLQVHPEHDGWRETGTLLKCIALLPYIRDMGFNTVHLLPITTIGEDGKKGNLGSPYAIRNPYRIDPNLCEPTLGLDAEVCFGAFVEAAHRLGLRVVMEFVLRTAARDSDWIPEHPDWFYWIRADIPDRTGSGRTGYLRGFGQPNFSQDDLNLLHWKIGQGDFNDLPAPSKQYQSMYTVPPKTVFLEEGRYIGITEDGTRVRIPGAFPDFPPNDPQPPWSDVTYLRLYDHPDFNYMAYNTLRMYDSRLAQEEHINIPLWKAIAGVIPHYQSHFGIDGVLLDMGHALPMQLKSHIVHVVRQQNPDFAFWDENFSISQQSRHEGYNAVVGYWMLGLHEPGSLRGFLSEMGHYPYPISFFAAPENHNTPRAASRYGGKAYAHYALALSVCVPGIPFILSGFELGEVQPMNTGLGFNSEQIAAYPADQLPLFSSYAFNWTRPDNYVRSVQHAMRLRQQYAALLADNDPQTFSVGHSDNPHILVFSRRKDDRWISIVANTDLSREQSGRVIIGTRPAKVPGLWGVMLGPEMDMAYELATTVNLAPGYVIILDSHRAY